MCTHQRRIEGGAIHSNALVGILVRRGIRCPIDADAGRRQARVAGEGEAGWVVLAGADGLTRHRVGHNRSPVLTAGATASAGRGRRAHAVAVQGTRAATGNQVRSAWRGSSSDHHRSPRRGILRVLRKGVGTECPRGDISASSSNATRRLARLAVRTTRGAHRRGVCHHQRVVHVRGGVLRWLGTRRQELKRGKRRISLDGTSFIANWNTNSAFQALILCVY